MEQEGKTEVTATNPKGSVWLNSIPECVQLCACQGCFTTPLRGDLEPLAVAGVFTLG